MPRRVFFFFATDPLRLFSDKIMPSHEDTAHSRSLEHHHHIDPPISSFSVVTQYMYLCNS